MVTSLSRQVWRQGRAPTCDGDGILYLLTAYPLWSETFLLGLRLLQRRNLPIHAVALYSGDTEVKPDWPGVQVLSATSAPQHRGAARHKFGIRSSRLTTFANGCVRSGRCIVTGSSCSAFWLNVAKKRVSHIHAEIADLAALLGGGGGAAAGLHASASAFMPLTSMPVSSHCDGCLATPALSPCAMKRRPRPSENAAPGLPTGCT